MENKITLSKEYTNNTRKLIRTHKRLVEAYYMFAYEEHNEQIKKDIIKMCKHILEQFEE